MTLPELCDVFLDNCQRHSTQACYENHRYYLQSFCEFVGGQLLNQLKPFHVTKWLDQHVSWKGSRRHAIAAVQRVFNWAISQGLLQHNPFRNIVKPGPQSRNRILTKEERERIVQAIPDQSFRDFVLALQETGCRPSEIARLTADEVNLEQGIWLMQRHKTRHKTGRPRVIYLTPVMIELSRRLIKEHPTGALFRNTRGEAFSRNAVRCRFRRLRIELGLQDVVCYSYRHTYATEALVNGVGIAQVSELLGHTSTCMVMKHYGHLSQQLTYMREVASKAIGR
jgi:integrase